MFRKKDIIYTIYREGGFSKAAEVLHIAQPSLSVMVSKLERELGEKLFDRSQIPLKPTEAGLKYLEACEHIRLVEEDFQNYLDELKGVETGRFTLGTSNIYMTDLLPDILAVYSARYPGVAISLHDLESLELPMLLKSGEVDVALDNDFDVEDSLEKHFLGREFLFIGVPISSEIDAAFRELSYSYEEIAGGTYLKEKRYAKDLAAFAAAPFIQLQEGFDTRTRSNAVFAAQGLSVHSTYELNQLSSAFAMAASGLGLTVVSDTLVRPSANLGRRMRYYAIDHPLFVRDVVIYTRRGHVMSHAIRKFIEISRETSPLK